MSRAILVLEVVSGNLDDAAAPRLGCRANMFIGFSSVTARVSSSARSRRPASNPRAGC